MPSATYTVSMPWPGARPNISKRATSYPTAVTAARRETLIAARPAEYCDPSSGWTQPRSARQTRMWNVPSVLMVRSRSTTSEHERLVWIRREGLENVDCRLDCRHPGCHDRK
jgi:hypothetical protein